MPDKECRKCKITKSDDEYYPYRRVCKKCISEENFEKRDAHLALNVKEIRCVKCKMVKPADCFQISEKKQRYKDICKDCTGYYLEKSERYIQLESWIKELFKNSSETDFIILKKVIKHL